MMSRNNTNSMVRYNIECASCGAVLGIITVFGEVQSSKARGILGSSGYYQIKLDSCARCSDKVKTQTVQFHMAADLLQKIKEGQSLTGIQDYLQSFAPPENDFLQKSYPVKPGEPPSYDDMAKHLKILGKQSLSEKKSFTIRIPKSS